jgi:hypothetical protein
VKKLQDMVRGLSFVGGLGSGSSFMTPVMIWGLVAVIGIGIGIGRFIAVRKAEAEARRAQEAALRAVPVSCRARGHAYQQYGAGYRCATCGNYVSSREGESYGLAKEGRIDRRRYPR